MFMSLLAENAFMNARLNIRGSINVEFNADGTGEFEWYNAPEAGPFLWKMVSVKEASFPGVTVEMFELPGGAASSKVLRLWIENVMIWMEPAD